MPTMSLQTSFELFKKSYENYEQYPTNLIYKTEYQGSLDVLREGLSQQKGRLCQEIDIDVRFRDFDHRCAPSSPKSK
jgi:hypothetical protein